MQRLNEAETDTGSIDRTDDGFADRQGVCHAAAFFRHMRFWPLEESESCSPSIPEQTPRPAPVTMMARTATSLSAWSNRSK